MYLYRGPVVPSSARGLSIIAVLDLLAVTIGLALEAWWETLAPVSVAVAAVGVIRSSAWSFSSATSRRSSPTLGACAES
jgi:hypothetical protein